MKTPLRERKITRLPHFDYGQSAAYFVTICTDQRRVLFGEIIEGIVQLSPLGELVRQAWLEIPGHYTTVTAEDFVIMPNHLHGILFVNREDAADMAGSTDMASHDPTRKFGQPRGATLSSIVGAFKSGVTREAHRLGLNADIWQSRFYEHIIRNDEDLNNIRKYIQENPMKWELDKENPNS